MTTKVRPCSCTSVLLFEVKCGTGKSRESKPKCAVPWMTQTAGAAYQDAKYGKGLRLHNIGGKGQTKTATCTVCGKHETL